MSEQQVEKGDQVSWKWGSSKPSGEVGEVSKKDAISIGTANGNTVTRKADAEDPAVHVAREGNDVVKRAHELTIEEKANGKSDSTENGAKSTEAGEKQAESTNKAADKAGDAKAGADEAKPREKRAPSEDSDETEDKKVAEDTEEPAAKKQKTNGSDKKQNGDSAAKKGRGRPKKADSTDKVATRKKEPKPAATADGKPRRSARNAT